MMAAELPSDGSREKKPRLDMPQATILLSELLFSCFTILLLFLLSFLSFLSMLARDATDKRVFVGTRCIAVLENTEF